MSNSIDEKERDKVFKAFQAAVCELNKYEPIKQALEKSEAAQPSLDEADTALVEDIQDYPFPHSVLVARAHLSQDGLDALDKNRPLIMDLLTAALAEHQKARPLWIQVLVLMTTLREVEPHVKQSALVFLDELRRVEPDDLALQEFQSHLEQMNDISTNNV